MSEFTLEVQVASADSILLLSPLADATPSQWVKRLHVVTADRRLGVCRVTVEDQRETREHVEQLVDALVHDGTLTNQAVAEAVESELESFEFEWLVRCAVSDVLKGTNGTPEILVSLFSSARTRARPDELAMGGSYLVFIRRDLGGRHCLFGPSFVLDSAGGTSDVTIRTSRGTAERRFMTGPEVVDEVKKELSVIR